MTHVAAAAQTRAALASGAGLHYTSVIANASSQLKGQNIKATGNKNQKHKTFTSNAFGELVLLKFKNFACHASSGNDLCNGERVKMKDAFFAKRNKTVSWKSKCKGQRTAESIWRNVLP